MGARLWLGSDVVRKLEKIMCREFILISNALRRHRNDPEGIEAHEAFEEIKKGFYQQNKVIGDLHDFIANLDLDLKDSKILERYTEHLKMLRDQFNEQEEKRRQFSEKHNIIYIPSILEGVYDSISE